MTEYQLHIFGASDRDAFRALFARTTSPVDPAAQARREWWCFDNPSGGAFAVFTAADEIAATCYLGGKRLAAGAGAIAGYEIGETATDPAHQRKGLFSKLVTSCVAHAAEQGGQFVYGTPNAQSTPGYAKLRFDIVSGDQSWLFLLPNLGYWLRVRPPWPMTRIAEIGADDYVRETAHYPRLNRADETYLDWRLRASPNAYRYFAADASDGRFLCAIRHASLGRYRVLTCAEYFLDGVRPPPARGGALLRAVATRRYRPREWFGLQMHGSLPPTGALGLRLRGILPHRILPICATALQGSDDPRDWFERFQLSDCDIG